MHSQLPGVTRVALLQAFCALAGICALAACGPLGGVDDTGGFGGAAGQGQGASAGSAATALPPEPAFKVVGYQPSWAGTLAGLQFDKLNYVNYAFALEASDGSVSLPQPTRLLSDLVSRGHAAGVRVLLSVGGWNDGNDRPFTDLSANPDTRAKFVATLAGYVDIYQLDGIDVDWEFPEPAVAAQFTALMHDLSATLKPKGKLLTIAGSADHYGGDGVTADALPYIDFVNIMAYDGGQGAGHSPYALAQSSLQYWLTKGLPPARAVVGVPFYSRPGYTPYSMLVAQDPQAANLDELNQQFYNGIPTVQAKTALAMASGGGIMAWDLSQDTRTPELSLLSAIYAKSHPAR
jgi:chitinase